MRWASAISRRSTLKAAGAECTQEVASRLGTTAPDLLLVFVSPHFAEAYLRLPEEVSRHLDPAVLLGCSGGGVIGGGHEVEHRPAVSMIAATLPGVHLTPFHLETGDLPDLDGPPDRWRDLVGVPADSDPSFVLLADPFSFEPEALLPGLDYAYPGAVKVGGLASGAGVPGGNALFLNDRHLLAGTVGVALSGNVEAATVVARGCRPIGEVMQVTRSEKNLIYELDGVEALAALQELIPTLDERDRRLVQVALHVGIVTDEFIERPGRGDFLIRNLVGADPDSGVIAVSQLVPEGSRIRFHLQDAASSAEDLRDMLSIFRQERGREFSGALFFSCLARGQGLYKRPNFDSSILRSYMGDLPTGGFFCNGEIGGVGGATHLHAYTASIGFFRPR
jgi:small ligand-binding sensory domain FIST